MERVGCLGEIPFIVNTGKILTPQNIQWSGSARIAEHQRHLYHALTEFTGIDADKFTFDLMLSTELGVNVPGELVKIFDYERNGKAVILVIGEKTYGKYRWLVKSHAVKMKYFDRAGNLSLAAVSVSLLEYLNV